MEEFQLNNITIVRKEAEKLEAELNFLASLPLFKDWTHKALKSILYLAPIEKFQRGHFVYKEGDPCEKLYIVKKGEFRVNRNIILIHNSISSLGIETYRDQN